MTRSDARPQAASGGGPDVALVVVRASSHFLPTTLLVRREAAALAAAGDLARQVVVVAEGDERVLADQLGTSTPPVVVTWSLWDLTGPVTAVLGRLLADGAGFVEVSSGIAARVEDARVRAVLSQPRRSGEDERRRHAAMTRSGRRDVAREGRWLGGRLPLGWTSGPNGDVVLDLAVAGHIRSAIGWVAAGRSPGSVAARWNASGFTTAAGGRWRSGNVRRVLLRARNAGLVEHRGEIVGRSEWPAIVTIGQWREAVSAMSRSDQQRSTA